MSEPRKMRFYSLRDIDSLPQLKILSPEERFEIKVVAHVLPFRVNNYVVEELIDWNNVPDDPIFQLTFMQKNMLKPKHYNQMAKAVENDLPQDELKAIANEIRYELNPHPAGQMTTNVPLYEDERVRGIQHKYRETCLIFPSSGQTCHAYCTFCFRWAQFVGMGSLKFATDESNRFQQYIKDHSEITDILLTGGDPMIMSLPNLKAYLEPLLEPEFEHIRTIRIGTKSVAYWPFRYVTDKDANGILRLFEKVVNSGKHLAIMGHYNHWKELSTDVSKEAIKRIRNTGAQIRTQSPLIKHINDNPDVWATMWQMQINLGCIPYYMFVERDTGAHSYFAVPLARAQKIYQEAYTKVSGLGRTVRGPSMSAAPGKVEVLGVTEIYGEKVFVLNLLQGRNPDWVKKPFFARYDEKATWLDHLVPAFGKDRFFFEDEMDLINRKKIGQIFFNEGDEEYVHPYYKAISSME